MMEYYDNVDKGRPKCRPKDKPIRANPPGSDRPTSTTMIVFLKPRITIKRNSDARRMFILCDLPAAYCKKRD